MHTKTIKIDQTYKINLKKFEFIFLLDDRTPELQCKIALIKLSTSPNRSHIDTRNQFKWEKKSFFYTQTHPSTFRFETNLFLIFSTK